MAGKIIADQIQSTTAGTIDTKFVVSGSAKARGMYDQIATTVQTTLNVSSVTDDSTGTYTYNYTNAFTTSPFRGKVYAGSGPATRVVQFTGGSSTTTTQFRVANPSTDGVVDTNSSVIVHGDLA